MHLLEAVRQCTSYTPTALPLRCGICNTSSTLHRRQYSIQSSFSRDCCCDALLSGPLVIVVEGLCGVRLSYFRLQNLGRGIAEAVAVAMAAAVWGGEEGVLIRGLP